MRARLFVFIVLASGALAKDCDKAPENYGVKANYSTQPLGRKYQNGTKVEFTCENGNSVVYGSSVAICLYGKWTPELGRCPYLCSYEDLEKKGDFLYVRVVGQTPNQKWFVHGTKGRTHCAYYGFDIWTTSKYREWICVDGGWKRLRRGTGVFLTTTAGVVVDLKGRGIRVGYHVNEIELVDDDDKPLLPPYMYNTHLVPR